MASRTTTTMTPMTWRWRRMSSPSLFPLPSPTTITLTMPSHLVPLELHMDRSLPSPLSSRDMLKTFLGLFILLCWFLLGITYGSVTAKSPEFKGHAENFSGTLHSLMELHMDRSLPSPLSSRDMLKTFLGLFILLWFIAGEGSRG